MKFIEYSQFSDSEKLLVEKAFEAAERSVAEKGHKVGCAILCSNDDIFVGATNARSRAIGSTCAERMAVDQLFFHGNDSPSVCVLVSLFKRKKWTKNSVATPCGVCLEMFWELTMKLGIGDLDFICVSWNKKRALKLKLSQLYPRFEAVRR